MEKNRLEWNLNSLKQGESGFHFFLKPGTLGIKDIAVGEKIECDFVLNRDGDKIYLQGIISFELQLECARCFEKFVLNKKEKLLAYFIKKEPFIDEEEGLSQTDVLTEYYRNDIINLEHVFFDTIILSIPMKPLCKDNCKGLCPICGTNLNIKQCDCKRENIDPRWAPLMALKGEGKRGRNEKTRLHKINT